VQTPLVYPKPLLGYGLADALALANRPPRGETRQGLTNAQGPCWKLKALKAIMVCSSSRFGLLFRTRGRLAAPATAASTTASAPTSLLDNLLFGNTERKMSIAGQIALPSLHLVVNNETQE
jgi:hypothetical protein